MRTNQDGLGRSVTISDKEIGLLDGDQTLVQQTELNVSERFSALLWMPHCQHKISKVWENGNHVIGGSSTQYMLTNTIEFGKAWLMRSNILTRQVCHNIVIGFNSMGCTLFFGCSFRSSCSAEAAVKFWRPGSVQGRSKNLASKLVTAK
uniref:Uncharacterized protein n=1 Tax=Oryza barthii TaxID=65489 RepID=A0A0D3F8V3_9ORYZ